MSANHDLAPATVSRKNNAHIYNEVSASISSSALVENVKAAQSVDVSQRIIDEGLVHTSLVLKEVDWFFNRMGIDDAYFLTTPTENVAKHISCIYAGKILAIANGISEHDFKLKQEEAGQAFYAVRSLPGSRLSGVFDLERMIDARYLLEGYTGSPGGHECKSQAYRIKVFRSSGPISDDLDVQLRFYLLQCPKFRDDIEVGPDETDLQKISDSRMLELTSAGTHKIYQRLLNEIAGQLAPAMTVEKTGRNAQRRLVIAYHQGTVHSFFSSLTDLYHQRQLFSPKKFVEQFANGVTIVSVYLRPIPLDTPEDVGEAVVDERMSLVVRDAALLFCLARTALTPMFSEGILSGEEATYAYVGWKYAHQFLSRYRREYSALLKSVELHEPAMMGHLLRLKQNLRKDTFTEQRVLECIKEYPALLKALFVDFARRHGPDARAEAVHRIQGDELPDMSALETLITRSVKSEFDNTIFLAIVNFNRYVLKTNYFKQKKIALSFRLHPQFLSADEYPSVPHGVFFIVGSVFRGFHVRFDDVARGGIRIIRSSNPQVYAHNVGAVFDENYNLASTQQRKNKDIPEGGSKGTIFLSQNHQDKAEIAFRQYVDALCDLLIKDDEIVDYLQDEEILFLGPDEGTAEFMDWASQHARSRGLHFWKAFTTGKSTSLGGIPHDTYGMTTRSVHQYVLGVLRKLELDEKSISKFQTGGPDGDLGSNEILISCDRTKSVVDGSGVLYDPNGIDRTELRRLASARLMCNHFDRAKLSPQGFYLGVDERNVTLPNGDVVDSGLRFRNCFHLNPMAAAELFVPCGGRPEAINLNNYEEILEDGVCRFKVIVEGANLFISQQARLNLEKHGVIIFKDASANKGGVTSSSLEVLAALALSDEEFQQHMMVLDGVEPEFYTRYVREVQNIIESNAALEFECIWRENQLSGTSRCQLTDTLSIKINQLNDSLRRSSMWSNELLRRRVITDACPPSLIELLGIDTLLERVPEKYLQAIFGASLASKFMYKFGTAAPEFSFFEFMQGYLHQV